MLEIVGTKYLLLHYFLHLVIKKKEKALIYQRFTVNKKESEKIKWQS